MCGNGLNVSRPASRAVGSPFHKATSPCANSCEMIVKRIAMTEVIVVISEKFSENMPYPFCLFSLLCIVLMHFCIENGDDGFGIRDLKIQDHAVQRIHLMFFYRYKFR